MSPIPLGILAVAGSAPAGAFELISSTILTSSASSVTFSSIPQDYKHLQIRAVARSADTGAYNRNLNIRLNADSGTSYRAHRLTGNGSTVFSSDMGNTMLLYEFPAQLSTANAFNGGVIDILDYANTSKNTTVKSLSGWHESSLPRARVFLSSGLWINTTAVTSVTLLADSGNLLAGSRFSLYGLRG